MDYDLLKIQSYTYWDVYLHENQCYIGRVFLLLRDDSGVDDFLAIQGDVKDEFFSVGSKVKKALHALFKPDKMNYAALSNTSEHIHVHFIPRYKEARDFCGVTFKDDRWGKNYAPYDKSYTTNEHVLFSIRDAIQKELEQLCR